MGVGAGVGTVVSASTDAGTSLMPMPLGKRAFLLLLLLLPVLCICAVCDANVLVVFVLVTCQTDRQTVYAHCMQTLLDRLMRRVPAAAAAASARAPLGDAAGARLDRIESQLGVLVGAMERQTERLGAVHQEVMRNTGALERVNGQLGALGGWMREAARAGGGPSAAVLFLGAACVMLAVMLILRAFF